MLALDECKTGSLKGEGRNTMTTDRFRNAKRSVLQLAIVVLTFASISTTLQAGVTEYSSQAAFTAATTGLTNVDFNGIAAPGSFISYGNGPLVLSGTTITSNASMFVIDPGYYGFSYLDGFLNADYATPNDTLTFTLPAPVTAVGFDFGSLFSGGASFDVTLGGLGPYLVSSSGSTQGGSLGFAGFTSTTSFSVVTLTMPDTPNYNAVDNFQFGSAAVPEPISAALLGTALLGLAAAGIVAKKT